jgi:hypothetical protein
MSVELDKVKSKKKKLMVKIINLLLKVYTINLNFFYASVFLLFIYIAIIYVLRLFFF